jgi:hypothetical protein
MKIKEIKEKKSKIKEIEVEEDEKIDEDESLENFIEDDIEQFSEEKDIKKSGEEVDFEEADSDNNEKKSSSVLLEDAVADAPPVSESKRQEKDSYKVEASIPEDFYSARDNKSNNLYSQGNELYNAPNKEGEPANGEGRKESGENFYSLVAEEQEKVGEIHSARGSHLELEGVRGAVGKKNLRKSEEKYSARGY